MRLGLIQAGAQRVRERPNPRLPEEGAVVVTGDFPDEPRAAEEAPPAQHGIWLGAQRLPLRPEERDGARIWLRYMLLVGPHMGLCQRVPRVSIRARQAQSQAGGGGGRPP